MANTPVTKTNFNAGIVDRQLFGRGDTDKLAGALADATNMIPTVGGALVSRPGLVDFASGMPRNHTRYIIGANPQPTTHPQGFYERPDNPAYGGFEVGTTSDAITNTVEFFSSRQIVFRPNAKTTILLDCHLVRHTWYAAYAGYLYAWGVAVNAKKYDQYNPSGVDIDFSGTLTDGNPWTGGLFLRPTTIDFINEWSTTMLLDELSVSFDGDIVYLAHRSIPPLKLIWTGSAMAVTPVVVHYSSGVAETVGALSGYHPPMQRFDSDLVRNNPALRFTNEKLIATVTTSTTHTGHANLAVNAKVELDIGGLPVYGTITARSVNGSAITLTVDLVLSVVEQKDKTARYYATGAGYTRKGSFSLYPNDNNATTVPTYDSPEAHMPYDKDSSERLKAGELGHVRCDKITFSSAQAGMWFRMQDNYNKAWHNGGTPSDKYFWVKLASYVGLVSCPCGYRSIALPPAATGVVDAWKAYDRISYQEATTGRWDYYSVGGLLDNERYRHLIVLPNGTFPASTYVSSISNGNVTFDKAGATFSPSNGNHVRTFIPNKFPSVIEDITTMVPLDAMAYSTGPYEVTEDWSATSHTLGAGLVYRLTPSKITFSPDRNLIRYATVVTGTAMFTKGDFMRARINGKWTSFYVPLTTPSGWSFNAIQSDGTAQTTVMLLGPLNRSQSPDAIDNSGVTQEYVQSLWHRTEPSYPNAVTVYNGRLCFAGGRGEYGPQFWFSASTNPMDFRPSNDDGTVNDTNAIVGELSSIDVTQIRWMYPEKSLIVGTDSSEWTISGTEAGRALTPTGIRAMKHSSWGSIGHPASGGNALFFIERNGKSIIELDYSYESDGYKGTDLTLLSRNILLTDTKFIQMAWTNTPHPILWCRTDGGKLLTLTYSKPDGVFAWSRMEFNQVVLSVARFVTPDINQETVLVTFYEQGLGTPHHAGRMYNWEDTLRVDFRKTVSIA